MRWPLAALTVLLLSTTAHAQISAFTPNTNPLGTDLLPTVPQACKGQVGCNYNMQLQSIAKQLIDGTLTAPAVGFTNSTNTGLYRNTTTGGTAFTVQGTYVGEFQPLGLYEPKGFYNLGTGIFQRQAAGPCNPGTGQVTIISGDPVPTSASSMGVVPNGYPANCLQQTGLAGFAGGTAIALAHYEQADSNSPQLIVQGGVGVTALAYLETDANLQLNYSSTGVTFTNKNTGLADPIPAAALTASGIQVGQFVITNDGIVPNLQANNTSYYALISSIQYDSNGNATGFTITPGWVNSASHSSGLVPSGAQGWPTVQARGSGYKPGDTVSFSPSSGVTPTNIQVQSILSSGAVGTFAIVNANGSLPGNQTQTATSGSGTGLVLNFNPTLYVAIGQEFARNTVLSLGYGANNRPPFASYAVADEIDLQNAYGDYHLYDGSGYPLQTQPVTTPINIHGIDVFTFVGTAGYGYSTGGPGNDFERSFISSGARQCGYCYTPQGGNGKSYKWGIGFYSNQTTGTFLQLWPATGFTSAPFQVDNNGNTNTFSLAEGYIVFTPANAGTVALQENWNQINGSGTFSSLTLSLPTPIYDGQITHVSFNQAVTTATWNNGAGSMTIVNAPSAITANTSLLFQARGTSWYYLGKMS